MSAIIKVYSNHANHHIHNKLNQSQLTNRHLISVRFMNNKFMLPLHAKYVGISAVSAHRWRKSLTFVYFHIFYKKWHKFVAEQHRTLFSMFLLYEILSNACTIYF